QLEQLLDVGNLLAQFGFLSEAEACYRQGLSLSPNDLRPWVNLANLARDRGDHASARSLYERVYRQLPDHPILRRNLLVGLEYDPAATEAERLHAARTWGDWAITRAGGPRPRPTLKPLRDRPLRLGYVS
ncbi:hypothetical protein U5801_29400, partial [Lamprobacter modestohalophilus]|uniref:tetratricopeptide repeat protein n=1 Tax=Lamprobacter modestohalophilus TaxID=1064514 RepID=UPI002ADEEC40